MVDWSKYGLGEFAEGFNKRGIRSLDHLREMAPFLEEQDGLTGLCDLLGVERKKEAEPAPAPKVETKKSTASTPAYSGLERFLNTGLVVCAVLTLMIFAVVIFGAKWGLFKGSLTVTLSSSYGALLDLEKAELTMISVEGEHKIKSERFGDDYAATLKIPPGEYDTYVSCDGWSFFYGRYISDGVTDDAITLELDNIVLRVAVLEFFDEKGNELVPGKVSVVREGNEEPESCSWMEENRFVLLLPTEIAEETLWISADGYETVAVEHDWSGERFYRLEVVLKDA